MTGTRTRKVTMTATLISLCLTGLMLDVGCGPPHIEVNVGADLYTCRCVCPGYADTDYFICADGDAEAFGACHTACSQNTCVDAQLVFEKADYDACNGGAEGAARIVAKAGPESSKVTLDTNLSYATAVYFGQSPVTISVSGDVRLSGGCEEGTCPISLNLMYLKPDSFSVTAPDSSDIKVSDVYIINDGEIATTQSDAKFTIPASRVRVIVNGYVNGDKKSATFYPEQDIYGYYVPSTGQLGLFADFFYEGGLLDLQLNLEGRAE